MALLAETLVDEWLNRNRYFTIRGLRRGVHEIDLLGIRLEGDRLVGVHVEVQASFNPIAHIARLLPDHIPEFGAAPGAAGARPREVVDACVAAWVDKKFKSDLKRQMRASSGFELDWRMIFVHARVYNPYELKAIAANGIEVISLKDVLAELHRNGGELLTTAAGTDVSRLINYYAEED